MNIEEINKTIENYEALEELVKSTIDIIKQLDNYYDTDRGVMHIEFFKSNVHIEYDTSRMGCYSSDYFSFPIEWLSLSTDELRKVVLDAKEYREAEKRRIDEQEKLLKQKEVEERELKTYLKLKEKFDK